MVQLEGSLGKLLESLLKTCFSLMKNVLKPLAKIVLIPLGLTAAASAVETRMHKNISESGTYFLDLAKSTTLIILNEEMNDIMKIVKSLKESVFLYENFSKTIKNEAK